MSLTKNIDSYADVERVFRIAQLNPNGCSARIGDNKAAQRWRMRAYYFRKLWADTYSEANKHASTPELRALGFAHKSPWDNFVLTVEDEYVVIKPSDIEVLEIIPADGIMPDDMLMTDTEVLNALSGPAAPMVITSPGVEQDEDDKFSADKPLF